MVSTTLMTAKPEIDRVRFVPTMRSPLLAGRGYAAREGALEC
jgi:hypothetical protein